MMLSKNHIMAISLKILFTFFTLTWSFGQIGDPLKTIEVDIDQSFAQALQKKTLDDFKKLEMPLEHGFKKTKSTTNKYLYAYWLSYLNYYKSIAAAKQGAENVEQYLDKAIGYLEKIKNKDVEVIALLALEESYKFQFIPRQEMILQMNKINKYLEKALKLDKNNVRANYVNGNYDYYTPKEYGGGKKTEDFLLKAISAKNSHKPFFPTWGKEDAYRILILYYVDNKRSVEAKDYFKKAKSLFPNSHLIQSLKDKVN